MSAAKRIKLDAAAATHADNVAKLEAITPLDGRYKDKVKGLSAYFSEASYFKYRCKVEIEYFIELTGTLPQLAGFPKEEGSAGLRKIYTDFTTESAMRIKELEKVTNHDVKATEYFIKEEYDRLGLPASCKEFIHFGLTSQDVNNTAVPMAMKACVAESYTPMLTKIRDAIATRAADWDHIPMLARTHGQPATPTRLGKEMMVFVERLDNEMATLAGLKHYAKFGGATGSLNAHHVAYPSTDWRAFANGFITRLGLDRQQHTTQIEHYDGLAAICHSISRINTILTDLCRDVWQYISLGYFAQKVVKNEVGSSAMPHKVNPIDFENAEGNFGVANALFGFLASKMPISRLQRDLTDSTVSRTIGMPFGHCTVALKSLEKGLGKISVNEHVLKADLDANWAVVAEAIQTILRREAYPNPYEALKDLTRTGDKITEKTIKDFIARLDVSAAIKAELAAISPHTFTGIAL